jgi:hypothetical protein
MAAGVLKIPDPMVAPMAIMVSAKSDSPRVVLVMVLVWVKRTAKID